MPSPPTSPSLPLSVFLVGAISCFLSSVRITNVYRHLQGFPSGSAGKASACNAGDLGSIPGLGRSLGGSHGNLLQYSCLENPREQRSLVDYSPKCCRELDMLERLSMHASIGIFISSATDCVILGLVVGGTLFY